MNPPDSWDSEQVFHHAHDFYGAVLGDIARAQRTIDLEIYIFSDDDVGHRFMEALREAAGRGVRVRVIGDGFGASGWAAHHVPGLLEAGVEARVFRPMPWRLLKMAANRLTLLNNMVGLFMTLNRRNHRKLWLVDGRIAYVGSLNISKNHLETAEGGANWRDTGVRVEGPAVAEMAWAFEKTWSISWRFGGWKRLFHGRHSMPKPRRHSCLVRLNDRIKSRKGLFRDLLNRISFSKRRVWITTPYFIPSRRLVRRLCRTARRGVDVRILIPRRPDVRFVQWVAAAYFDLLLPSGVRVFEYLPGVLHAKLVRIDDWATVGTSNLNHRSMLHDLEVDLVVTHDESKASLERQFLLDLTQSEEVTERTLESRSWMSALAGRILLLFRYWM